MDNEMIMQMLAERLNQEMKNVIKKYLTNSSDDDKINVSNEREVIPNEQTERNVSSN